MTFSLWFSRSLPDRFDKCAAGCSCVDDVAANRDAQGLLIDRLDFLAPALGFFIRARRGDGAAGNQQGGRFGHKLITGIAQIDRETVGGVLDFELGILVATSRQGPGNIGGFGAGGQERQTQ